MHVKNLGIHDRISGSSIDVGRRPCWFLGKEPSPPPKSVADSPIPRKHCAEDLGTMSKLGDPLTGTLDPLYSAPPPCPGTQAKHLAIGSKGVDRAQFEPIQGPRQTIRVGSFKKNGSNRTFGTSVFLLVTRCSRGLPSVEPRLVRHKAVHGSLQVCLEQRECVDYSERCQGLVPDTSGRVSFGQAVGERLGFLRNPGGVGPTGAVGPQSLNHMGVAQKLTVRAPQFFV